MKEFMDPFQKLRKKQKKEEKVVACAHAAEAQKMKEQAKLLLTNKRLVMKLQ